MNFILALINIRITLSQNRERNFYKIINHLAISRGSSTESVDVPGFGFGLTTD